MHPVTFEGAVEIKKPETMTDEECMSVWAHRGFGQLYNLINAKAHLPPGVFAGVDQQEMPYYLTAWKPNKEDLDALNRGEPVYVRTLSTGLPPMALFTLDEHGGPNWE